MHKRKHRKSNRGDNWEPSAHTTGASRVESTFSPSENLDSTTPDSCLYIQAYEADVTRGPPAVSASHSLECQEPSLIATVSNSSRPGLIRWDPAAGAKTVEAHELNQPLLWVDRYDVRLLLDRLPDFQSDSTQVRPLSPSGWTDLPSDSEDTFFFSPDELEDYHREKRRRLINQSREERLRILASMDGEEEDSDPWGGSDEEPDKTQRELIRRTAAHVISSPNPAQLEMRILANYGADKRFAFLKGRWSRVWKTEKESAKQYQAEEAKKVQLPKALPTLEGLSGYGDSDSDGGESVHKPTEGPEDTTDMTCTQGGYSGDDVVKEARRARAREWSARRRAEQSLQPELA